MPPGPEPPQPASRERAQSARRHHRIQPFMREAYPQSGVARPTSRTYSKISTMDREPLTPKFRELLSKALFESALIVFSILLALAITGWKEDRDNHRLAS